MDRNVKVVKTVEMSLSDATKTLLVFSRLVGMNPRSCWHKIYPVCILAYEFLILHLVWQYWSRQPLDNYYFNIIVHAFQDSCRITSLLIILGSGLIDETRFMVPVTDIVNVDKNLNSLGGYIDNRSTYRFQVIAFIYAVVVPSFFWIVELMIYKLVLGHSEVGIIDLISGVYIVTVLTANAVADCSFSSTLFIIRRRFKEINSLIRHSENNDSNLRVEFIEVQRAHSNNDVLKELIILRREYHILWQIANKVNDAYGLHLLTGMTTSLALITSKLWESYSASITSDDSTFWLIVGGICWLVFYVTRMLILVQASESTVTEAKATSVVLQELGMKRHHGRAIKGEIRDFLMQLQFEVRKFTACDFFDIDFKLICGILGAVCTYFVILIQMDDSNGRVITAGAGNESIQFVNKSYS